MSLLALIPARVWEYLILIIGCALIAVGLIHHEREIGAARVEAVRQLEHARAAAVAASAIEANQAESNRRIAATQETVRVTIQHAAAVAADASAAAAARDAMRVQLDAFVRASRVSQHPVAAGPASAVEGSDTAGVLAGLLDESDRRAGVYARVAEERRVRAEGCERAADSLKPAP
jgi:Protein of unknown function (DUF2514)